MSGVAALGLAGALTAGGVAALASRNREVIRKWRTWAVSAPLVAGCLWLGAPGAALLAAGLAVAGAVEYGRLAKLVTADSVVVAAVAAAMPLVAWLAPGVLGRAFAGAICPKLLTIMNRARGMRSAARLLRFVRGWWRWRQVLLNPSLARGTRPGRSAWESVRAAWYVAVCG